MKQYDNFINIPFNSGNLDLYFQRKSILNVIKSNLPAFKGSLLDAGCGKMPYRDFILSNSRVEEYVGLDIETAKVYDEWIQPDYFWDGKHMPFSTNTFDCVFATEVLEHVPDPDIYLSEVFRVLKNGGLFFFTTPFLWPLHEPPFDEYRYTPFSMERILKKNGFTNIKINALGGWNASLGQVIGLWIKRSPMSSRKRKILQAMTFPILKHLYKHDNPNPDFFRGPMITGISGLGFKK